jgi:biopolymer transport protein ExbB/TolQ
MKANVSNSRIGRPARNRDFGIVIPILTGLALTVGLYALIAFGPLKTPFLERYFSSHPLEYVTTALFMIGMTILIAKLLRVSIEKVAFERPLVDLKPDADSAENVAAGIDNSLQRHTDILRSTCLAKRWRDVGMFLAGRKSAVGLDEHLKHLAELASERMADSYSLIRTITWAVPILGFLGTVIGITIAIANVTPEQLETSLGEVTGGLGVAFDTTALALALSIVLVFATFIVERSEQQILSRVEDFGITHLQHLFPQYESASLPEAQQQAALQLMTQTEQLVVKQTQMWNEELESMRSRWMQTLDHQSGRLNELLNAGAEAVLDGHVHQLSTARETLLTGFQTVTDEFVRKLEAVSTASDHRISHLQSALQESTTAAAEQMEALHQQGQLLLKIFEKEDQLVRLQERLDKNLETVRAAETFDETLHNLAAAVHLLTARTRKVA